MSPDSTFTPFALEAAPNTDIWKKPLHEAFNAPYKVLQKTSLAAFSSITTTFRFVSTYRYDQGGFLILLTHPSKPQKWIKAGAELEFGKIYLSVVGCDNWADWSVTPPPGGDEAASAIQNGHQKVTILARREGMGLWIYSVDSKGEEHPMREITWLFAELDDEKWQVSVAAMAARPSKETGNNLEVKFEDFQVVLDQSSS